jgi:hypothetical protein
VELLKRVRETRKLGSGCGDATRAMRVKETRGATCVRAVVISMYRYAVINNSDGREGESGGKAREATPMRKAWRLWSWGSAVYVVRGGAGRFNQKYSHPRLSARDYPPPPP